MKNEELIYHVALGFIPGVGIRNARHLLGHVGSAKDVFECNEKDILKIPGVGKKLSEFLKKNKDTALIQAQRVLENAEKLNLRVLHPSSPLFPNRLKQLPDAPNILFYKGEADLNCERTVAIVGTRRSSDYGRSITEKIVSELKDLGVMVVSGLAYGIDIHAHKACLKNGIPALAVLAGGLDQIYPNAHKKYEKQILQDGGILSESTPGTQSLPHLFLSRNRIIAGMSDATIVVESGAKGGSLITASIADSYDRPVFAVPGNLEYESSSGTNSLLAKQKALIYTRIDDLIYHTNWDKAKTKRPKVMPPLSEEEATVYRLLNEQKTALEIDWIAYKTQIPIHEVSSLLLSLEFKNLIKCLPGKKFELI